MIELKKRRSIDSKQEATITFSIKSLMMVTAFVALTIPVTTEVVIPTVRSCREYFWPSSPPLPFLSTVPYTSNNHRSSQRGPLPNSMMVTPRIITVKETEKVELPIAVEPIDDTSWFWKAEKETVLVGAWLAFIGVALAFHFVPLRRRKGMLK